MTGKLTDVLELDRIGVQVISVRESWLDTGSPVRTLLIAIFSWVAEQERNRLVERREDGSSRPRSRPRTPGPRMVRSEDRQEPRRGLGPQSSGGLMSGSAKAPT